MLTRDRSATVVKTEEHDSTNVDESNHKHDHVNIPEEDGEAAVVAEIKHEVDENDNTSNAADTEPAAAMADAEDEDVKMEEEIKEEDEGDGDVAANRVSTYLLPLPDTQSHLSHYKSSILETPY